MVKIRCFMFVIMSIALLTSCISHKGSSEAVVPETESDEIIEETIESEIQAEMDLSIPVYKDTFDTISSDGYFKFSDVTPLSVDGKSIYSYLGMISADELVVSMIVGEGKLAGKEGVWEEISPTEIGIWNVVTGDYTPWIQVEPAAWYMDCYDENYVVFTSNVPSGTFLPFGAHLWKYNRHTQEMTQIYEYAANDEGYSGAYWANQRILKDGWLYFENLIENDEGGWPGTAYRYKLDTDEMEYIGENMTNPLEMDGEIWYIQVDRNRESNKLKNAESGELIELPPNLVDIVSNGTDITTIYILGEQDMEPFLEEGTYGGNTILSVFALKKVDEESDAIAVVRKMTELKSSEYITTFSSAMDEHPMIYDNAKNVLYRIDHIGKGIHYYHLYENFGVIESYVYSEETQKYQTQFTHMEYIK